MGLRERKKERTRADLQRHALRLVRERGWAGTSVDDIADAAEVSRSTFFRYFPTKTDVVLFDDVDPLMVAALRAQPPGTPLLVAVRAALADALAGLDPEKRELEELRMELARTVPEIATAVRERAGTGVELLVDAITEASGRDPDDPDLAVFLGVVHGARLAARTLTQRAPGTHYLETLDAVLGRLVEGIPLADAPTTSLAT